MQVIWETWLFFLLIMVCYFDLSDTCHCNHRWSADGSVILHHHNTHSICSTGFIAWLIFLMKQSKHVVQLFHIVASSLMRNMKFCFLFRQGQCATD